MNNEQIAPMSSIKPKINPVRSYVTQSSEYAQNILFTVTLTKRAGFLTLRVGDSRLWARI